MALAVSFFKAIQSISGTYAQVPAGEPFDVQSTSSITVPDGAVLMRLNPQGGAYNITWQNGKVEYFDGTEFRGCTPGRTFTAAAA